MRDQVEEVKLKTDIVSLIGEHVKLSKAGKHYKSLCPFHSEKTPSFIVSPEMQIYKCFGCSVSGDAFTFLEEYEGMDFPQALKFLADRVGVKLVKTSGPAMGEKEILYQINELAAKFYHYILTSHEAGKKALNYALSNRGLDAKTIDEFSIGYAPENQSSLVNFLIHKKNFKKEDLVKSGVAVDLRGRLVDRFRGRLIFPLFDHRGGAVGLAGRILPNPNSDRLAKYINSPETPIYHKSSVLYGLNVTRAFIKKIGFALVVEGELDMISSFKAGVKNTVAIKGSALTQEQLRLLSRLTSNLVLALDSDTAGDAAAKRGIAIAQNQGMNMKVVTLGKFKDPDDFAQADPAGFVEAVKNASDIWEFLIDSISKKYNPKTGEGKAQISREVVPILVSIEDKILQDHYSSVLGAKLGVSHEAVLSQIEAINKYTSKDAKQKSDVLLKKPEFATRRELLEKEILTLGFSSNPSVLLVEKLKSLFSARGYIKLLGELEEFLLKYNKFDLKKFSKNIPEELKRILAEIAMKPTEEPEEIILKELANSYHELLILILKFNQKELTVKMAQFEKDKDKKNLKITREQYTKQNQALAKVLSSSFDPQKELQIS